MGQGAWRATAHGVAKSWTRLSSWARLHVQRTCAYVYTYMYIHQCYFPNPPTFFFPCCVYKSIPYLKACVKARLGVGGGGSRGL